MDQEKTLKMLRSEHFENKWLYERSPPFRGQDYYKLKDKLKTTDELFEDPEFVCDDDILFYAPNHNSKPYKWLRPHEICAHLKTPKEPQFFVKDLLISDVVQGMLGDCWFVSSITSLSESQKFLNRVVCLDNDDGFEEGKYHGIFHFRFWDFGEWVDVVVDDRLPVNEYNELVYSKSKAENEFWAALLEKAYAKFKGGYNKLHKGKIEWAFQDFSGGIIETYTIAEVKKRYGNVFELFNSLLGEEMIGAYVKDSADTSQLSKDHAYTILWASEFENQALILVRNPWGNQIEWRGAWSDNHPNWQRVSDDFKEHFQYKPEDDGIFYMSIEDFEKHFHTITICNMNHSNILGQNKKWRKIQSKGEWVTGITAGGPLSYEADSFYHYNPQFMLTLYENKNHALNTVSIAVLQRGIKGEIHKIRFDLYEIEKGEDKVRPMGEEFFFNKPPIGGSDYSDSHESHKVFKDMKPGKYLIVPSTSRHDKEGEFLLRVFVDNKFKLKQFDKKVAKLDKQKIESSSNILVDLRPLESKFKEYAPDEKLNWEGLKNVLCSFSSGGERIFTKQLCRNMIALMTRNYHRTINYSLLKKLFLDLSMWQNEFRKQSYYDENKMVHRLKAQKLRDVLISLGLNVTTNILNSLVFTYASDKALEIDDFLMCVVKAKTLIEHFSDDKIKATDRWTMRTYV